MADVLEALPYNELELRKGHSPPWTEVVKLAYVDWSTSGVQIACHFRPNPELPHLLTLHHALRKIGGKVD